MPVCVSKHMLKNRITDNYSFIHKVADNEIES